MRVGDRLARLPQSWQFELKRLSELVGPTGRVKLIKIDAEGHEAAVLAGMRALLQAHRPALIIETGSQAL